MSGETWIELLILAFAFLLLVSAGFLDASLQKRQRLSIREIIESGTSGGGSDRGVDQHGELRSAVDVATLVSVLVIGTAIAHLTVRTFSLVWLILVLPMIMLVILVVGRLIPASVVDRKNLADSPSMQRLGDAISVLMAPFLIIYSGATAAVERGPQSSDDTNGNGGDLTDSSSASEPDDGEQRGEIPHDEHEMISGILSLEEAFAREIMVPRPDVVAVSIDTSVRDVVNVAQDAGHSRIPVYEESIDQVRGIVYAKDLLRYVGDDVNEASLTDLMRPAMFVPESKRVDDLLKDLQRARVHLAIVVDEYGGTAGLVTIEDIIEEIVGEIQDEYDRELPQFEYGSDGVVTVDGGMNVDELSDLLGVPLPETDSDTIGGLVARVLGHIPEPGEEVVAGPISIKVDRVERRRVRTVHITLIDESGDQSSKQTVQVS
jgi:putative hemolysin